MREIKFRIWDESQEIFHYWGFDITEYLRGFTGIPHNNGIGIDYCRDNSEQYTGLKDKNGKEIYEGDILSDSYRTEVVKYVHFVDGQFCIGDEESELYLSNKHEEIIGNIHEQ